MAVVPARNEADVVGRAIASLAKQQYGGEFHIVLVDDHSDDGTAAAARAAAPAGTLTVIAADPLPPGWTGKLWAVEAGIRYAARFDPEYLLLTDADIAHPPGSLGDLAARALPATTWSRTWRRCTAARRRARADPRIRLLFLLALSTGLGHGRGGRLHARATRRRSSAPAASNGFAEN